MARRSQIKMMESILVLVVFFFLLVSSLVFYVRISRVQQMSKDSDSAELRAMEISQRVLYMPELQKIDTAVQADCFDLMKLLAFNETARNNTRYNLLFSNVEIDVTQIYPHDRGTMNIYSNKHGSTTKYRAFYMPITVYDPVDRSYNFAYVTIGVYS